MKRLILTSVIAILSIVFCAFSLWYVSSIGQQAEESVNKIQTLMTKNQYNSALEETNSLYEFLENNYCMLSMILHHEMLEEIQESVAVIKASLEHPDEEDVNFWLETSRSLEKIKNLKETEEPSFANVF